MVTNVAPLKFGGTGQIRYQYDTASYAVAESVWDWPWTNNSRADSGQADRPWLLEVGTPRIGLAPSTQRRRRLRCTEKFEGSDTVPSSI